jgi:hypothetical protein
MIAMSTIEHGQPEDISNLKDRGRLITSVPTGTDIKNKSLLNLSARVQNLMNASLDNEESDDSVDNLEKTAEEE